MAKISELADGGSLLPTDSLPIARNGSNYFLRGSKIKAAGLQNSQNINISGVVIGGASFDGTAPANITTTLAAISSGISNDVLVDDGSGLLKKRTANGFIWNTLSSPITGNLLNATYIPKANSSNGLTNSLIVETASGKIGVGIIPNEELTVNGTISATDNIISKLDIISNRNLAVDGSTILGKTFSDSTTINGIANFPLASSASLGLKIGGDTNLYRSSANILKTDDNLVVGTLGVSTTANDIIVHEGGQLKTRAVNSAIWNTAATFISGAGTANFLPKFNVNGSNALTNSSIYETATNNIGIGTVNASQKLTVSGNISASGTVFGNIPLDNGLLQDPTTKKLSVKLATGGGLQFNSSGELKLTPPAAASTVVVVRPSDLNSTDNQSVVRTNSGGELMPYFKTLIQASTWARNNLTGNVTIYVDEDTIEGSGGALPSAFGPNIQIVFIDQTTINAAFGTSSGLKAGIYVYSNDGINSIRGQISWANGVSSGNLSGTTYIRARYWNGANYTTQRKFTDSPRAINYNVYVSNDNTLVPGNLGSNPSNWINQTSTTQQVYIRAMATINNSKVEITNLNLISRTNCNDITVIDVGSSSQVLLRNVTISLLGSGFYKYSALRVHTGAMLTVQHELLYSPVSNANVYPGYALAIVGNKTGARDKTTATKLNYILSIDTKGTLRIHDWSPFRSNDSWLSTAVILDGDFLLNGGNFSRVDAGTLEMTPCLINQNSNFIGDRFNFGGPSGSLQWSSTTSSTRPLYFSKLSEIRLYGWNTPLKRWTIDGSVSTAVQKIKTLPALAISTDLTATWGSFSGNLFVYSISSPETIASYTQFHDFITTVGGTPYDFPNLPYVPLSDPLFPQFADFYVINEAGANYTLDYGSSVR